MNIVVRIINGEDFGGLYDISQINHDWQVTNVLPDENIILKKWNGVSWYEGFDELEVQVIRNQDKLNNEKQKYIQRIKDGQEKYAELSAEFRLAKLSGQISEETHSAIEEILIPVRNEVLAGQWMSALTKLEGIGSTNIGESLYNRLHNDIQTYINNSYTVEEILNRHG